VAANSDSPEEARETTADLVETALNTQTAQFALDQAEQASQSNSSDSSQESDLTNVNQSFAEIGKDASQQQVRNEFIASRDPEQNLGLSVDTKT
jgi:hypothetical protein